MSNIKDIAEAFRVDPIAHDPTTIRQDALAVAPIKTLRVDTDSTRIKSADPGARRPTSASSKPDSSSVFGKWYFAAGLPKSTPVHPSEETSVRKVAADDSGTLKESMIEWAARIVGKNMSTIKQTIRNDDEFDCCDLEVLLEAEEMGKAAAHWSKIATSVQEVKDPTAMEIVEAVVPSAAVEVRDEFDLDDAEPYFD